MAPAPFYAVMNHFTNHFKSLSRTANAGKRTIPNSNTNTKKERNKQTNKISLLTRGERGREVR